MNCVWKIRINNTFGTGFFCQIPFDNTSMKVLMTNYHVLDDNLYNEINELNLLLNDDKEVKIINLDVERKTYFNPYYDIAIIELKEDDNINDYLELDDNLFKDEIKAFYQDLSISILQYPHGNFASFSYGLATDIIDSEIKHICSTDNGSSGSPILNLSNNKVIGIHKQASIRSNFNKGTCLKFPLNEFKGNILINELINDIRAQMVPWTLNLETPMDLLLN